MESWVRIILFPLLGIVLEKEKNQRTPKPTNTLRKKYRCDFEDTARPSGVPLSVRLYLSRLSDAAATWTCGWQWS